jgi:hypothetical protein
MSWSGLNSGLYEQICRYAELTDKALIETRNEGDSSAGRHGEQLGKFLSEIDSLRQEDLSARLIWLIFNDTLKMSGEEIARLGKKLTQGSQDGFVTTSLEKLAVALASEQAAVRSRMRGTAR